MKYRIVKTPHGYKVERKLFNNFLFSWTPLTVFGIFSHAIIPRLFNTEKDAKVELHQIINDTSAPEPKYSEEVVYEFNDI